MKYYCSWVTQVTEVHRLTCSHVNKSWDKWWVAPWRQDRQDMGLSFTASCISDSRMETSLHELRELAGWYNLKPGEWTDELPTNRFHRCQMLFHKANQLLFLLNWKLPCTTALLSRLGTEVLCRSFSMSEPSLNLRPVAKHWYFRCKAEIFSVLKQKFVWGCRAHRPGNQGDLDFPPFVLLKSNGEWLTNECTGSQ